MIPVRNRHLNLLTITVGKQMMLFCWSSCEAGSASGPKRQRRFSCEDTHKFYHPFRMPWGEKIAEKSTQHLSFGLTLPCSPPPSLKVTPAISTQNVSSRKHHVDHPAPTAGIEVKFYCALGRGQSGDIWVKGAHNPHSNLPENRILFQPPLQPHSQSPSSPR